MREAIPVKVEETLALRTDINTYIWPSKHYHHEKASTFVCSCFRIFPIE